MEVDKTKMSVTNFEALSCIEDDELLIMPTLEPSEIFILGFLKGFNRRAMKRWQQKRLANYG